MQEVTNSFTDWMSLTCQALKSCSLFSRAFILEGSRKLAALNNFLEILEVFSSPENSTQQFQGFQFQKSMNITVYNHPLKDSQKMHILLKVKIYSRWPMFNFKKKKKYTQALKCLEAYTNKPSAKNQVDFWQLRFLFFDKVYKQ